MSSKKHLRIIRSCNAYRHITVETDVLATCTSSAHVVLGQTDVLVGVKAEIVSATGAGDGRLEFSVDCSANAAPQFEGRGGEDVARAVCAQLAEAYAHSQLRLTALGNLVIEAAVEGKKNDEEESTQPRRPLDQRCWLLTVDALVLKYGGNLADALSLAAKTALALAKVPKVVIHR